jgi:hypothetical protein
VERNRQNNIGLTEVCAGSTGSSSEVDRRAGSRRRTGELVGLCCRVIRQFRGPRATVNEPPKVQPQLQAAQQSNSWVAQPRARAAFDGTGVRGGRNKQQRRQIRWTCALLLFLASEATGLTMRWRWAACAPMCRLLVGSNAARFGCDLQPPHHQPSRPSTEACQGSGTSQKAGPDVLGSCLVTGAWAMYHRSESPAGGFLWVPSAVTRPRAPPLS